MSTAQELYQIYSGWTGTLHFWVIRELGTHLDCEYFPDSYQFKLYSGFVEESTSSSGIPGLSRPEGERSETIRLLRPEDRPAPEDLDNLFKEICLAAARVLEIRVGRKALPQSSREKSSPALKESKALAGESLSPLSKDLKMP